MSSKKSKIELLLPAGNWDTLKAAVVNGADAVYLGVKEFNARRRANNFPIDELNEVITYAHEKGVRIFCTLNTLVKNSELDQFFKTLNQIYIAGADAVIIQHISFLKIIKDNFPDLEVHLSTQSAITNSYAAKLVGCADRIILPREFSEHQIKEFTKIPKIPTEVFIQGAMCFCYSGKCLFSSFLGGRSGNRGLCAQPCRKKYNDSYLMSMKDLCLVNQIPNLINSGVMSLKVEGRLRSPEYVSAATKLYRTAIDSYYGKNFKVDKELFEEMELAFNREFTQGYFSNKSDLISPETPKGRGVFLGVIDSEDKIALESDVCVGDGVGIWLKNKIDGAVIKKIEKNNEQVSKSKKGDKVKIFIHAPIGTKIYKTSSIKPTKNITFKSNSKIKTKKRKLVNFNLPKIKNKQTLQNNLFLVRFNNFKEAKSVATLPECIVFYDIFAKDFSSEFGAYVPGLLTDKDAKKAVTIIKKQNIQNVLTADLGIYSELKDYKNLNIYLDYSLNIFNDLDVLFFSSAIPIISSELNLQELKSFKNKSFAVFVHGNIVLMNTKYSQLSNKLKDEKNYTFQVRKNHNYFEVLNSRDLGLFEEITELKQLNINQFFFDLSNNSVQTINLYKQILENKNPLTNKKNFTKGHFERGVI
ncbi:hypothetical protein HN587_02410 [Candidatus Woesearchaeota archaeon]|jgi:collagenase-like PrtC family protease|nr:hypothetical protein [Candidatus Woesearchaeota archaeon]